MNNWLKRNSLHLGIIAFFVVICFAYFSPVLKGYAPAQGDVLQAKAMQKEIMDVRARDGKGPLWTNQMFGGMPAFQIWVQYPMNISSYGITLIKGIFPDPVGTVLLYLLGAYLLFCVLRVNPWLSALGAIAFAFSSYNFIIIAAGHSNQALAIGFFAPILAGILLALRGNYWVGGSLVALFMALEIRANHVQMTYYLFIAIGILALIELYHALKAKQLQTYLKTLGVVAAAIVVGVLVNAGTLWTTYEYAEETIRGKSNLTAIGESEPKRGLDRTYAYEWSQGVGESFTFLVPNIYGGASSIEDLSNPESNTFKELEPIAGAQTPQLIAQIAQNYGATQYWGNKPFTAGPFYFSAIIVFLFVFGLFIVKHRWKWWAVSAIALLLLLSFGRNFPLVSDFFFNHVPMYNKFRAVESILAVAGLLVPFLAVLAIREAQEGKYDQQYLVKKLLWAGGITGGLCLILALAPDLFFSFKSPMHAEMVQDLGRRIESPETANKIGNAFVADRMELAKTDALRSFVFILLAFGITWAFITKKMKPQLAFGLLAAAVLVDLWQVDQRYFNKTNFVPKAQLETHYEPRDVDTFIMADKDPNFRVYDVTTGDPFKSADASYFHKTVGGFHSARMKRFQELVDNQLTKSTNQDVLDMLNTKYIITRDPNNGSYKMQRNPTACGNAWFVSTAQFARNADEEMKALSSFDAKKEVIVNESYRAMIDTSKLGTGVEGFINLVKYHPDHLTYDYSLAKPAIAVFSEIYYDKGWKMYIDGKEKPYFRADYLLRAAQLEAGNHKLEFKFEPVSYYAGEKISLAGSLLLLAGIGFTAYRETRKRTKPEKK